MNGIGRATRAFYDRYSYNFETAEHAPMQLEASLFGTVVRRVKSGDLVLDAGCGTGMATRLLRENTQARQVFGLELSRGSLERVKRLPDMPLAQADILDLPVRSDGVDLAVARGVIMTTGDPRRAFHELVRVTRPGGAIFVRLYNRRNLYHWAYRILGPVCRGIASVPGGRTALALVVVPPFWLVLQLFVLVLRGRPVGMSPRVLWNFFADQLLVPHNSFHTIDEVIGWGAEEGCRCEAHGAITLGQQIELLFVKQPRPAPTTGGAAAA